ncbi:MAG: gamma-glutamyl-phosphate reductase, partial [Bacteroidales bacterium]|nr:gamma-glutamyl-phosphate reductase [Bacteroidales bacterium]
MKELILEKGRNARNASRELAKINTAVKDLALKYIAEELEQNRQLIKKENEKDLENGRKKGLSQAFLDRLALNDARIDGMIKVLTDVISLKDPVGEIFNMYTLPNGLKVGQMRV